MPYLKLDHRTEKPYPPLMKRIVLRVLADFSARIPHVSVLIGRHGTLTVPDPLALAAAQQLMEEASPEDRAFLRSIRVDLLAADREVLVRQGLPVRGEVIICGGRRELSLVGNTSRQYTHFDLPNALFAGDSFDIVVRSLDPCAIDVTVDADSDTLPVAWTEAGDSRASSVSRDPKITDRRSLVDGLTCGDIHTPAFSATARFCVRVLRDREDSWSASFSLFRPVPTSQPTVGRLGLGPHTTDVNIPAGETWVPPNAPSHAYCQIRVPGPARAGDVFPIVVDVDQPIQWSASILRGYDSEFLPAFELRRVEG